MAIGNNNYYFNQHTWPTDSNDPFDVIYLTDLFLSHTSVRNKNVFNNRQTYVRCCCLYKTSHDSLLVKQHVCAYFGNPWKLLQL